MGRNLGAHGRLLVGAPREDVRMTFILLRRKTNNPKTYDPHLDRQV